MWKLEIDGIDRTSLVKSFRMQLSLNERSTASVVISDLVPDRLVEIYSYAKDGTTKMFGGLILRRSVEGLDQSRDDLDIQLSCADFMTFADWCSTTITYDTSVTLKTVLQNLVTSHLSAYGVTLDPAQVNGPTLSAFPWVNKRVSDALRELSDRTGYVIRMSPLKVLSMIVPGSIAAPFAMTDATPHCIDAKWQDSDAIPANKIVLTAGPSGVMDLTQTWIADGVATSWQTDVAAAAGSVVGYATLNGTDYRTVGTGAMYEWDAGTSTLYLGVDPVPTAGTSIQITYQAQFPFIVTAASGATPVIEHREARPDVLDPAQAQEIANGLLDQYDNDPREVDVTTDEDGLEPGQALTINMPTARALVADTVITSVSMVIVVDPDDGGEVLWQYDVAAIENEIYQGSYLDQWREMTGGGGSTSSGGGVSSGAGSSSSSGQVDLGGSRTRSVLEDPSAWAPVVDYRTFLPVRTGTVTVNVELWSLDSGITITARLYDVTVAAQVGISNPITSTTATPDSFVAGVTAGNRYRLEILSGTSGADIFGIGSVETAS